MNANSNRNSLHLAVDVFTDMNEGPLAKKMRIWNPAVDKTQNNEQLEKRDEIPLDCSQRTSFQMPAFFQNYVQLAPLMMMKMQQQRQLEEFARRQFFSTIQMTSQVLATRSSEAPSTAPSTTSSGPSTANPIVQSVLGQPLVNENCCAVCGSTFRLTGDLVQHMRNNHRKSKFKRKNEENST